MELQVFNENGEPFLIISVPYVPSSSDQAAGVLEFEFIDSPMTILNVTEFNDFIEEIIRMPTINMALGGLAVAHVDTAAGNLTLYDLVINDVIPLAG